VRLGGRRIGAAGAGEVIEPKDPELSIGDCTRESPHDSYRNAAHFVPTGAAVLNPME
jgi:hypothetical protein